MPISNGNVFKVVWVADMTAYNAISPKDSATAYFVEGAKKIYVNNVPYGFDSSEITPTVLNNLLTGVDTNSTDITLTINGSKLEIKVDVKLQATVGSNKWVNATEAEYDAGVTKLDSGTSTAYNPAATAKAWLESTYPAASQTATTTARVYNVIDYWYFKINASFENLLKQGTTGLQVSKGDIIDIAQDIVDKTIVDKKGQPGGYAELDTTGKVPASQLPGFIDDIIDVIIRTGQTAVYTSARFALLADGAGGAAITPTSGKLYNEYSGPATPTNKIYRWSGSAYVEIKNDELKTLTIGDDAPVSILGTGTIVIDHRTKWTVVS